MIAEEQATYCVGVDENGLGPRLGPLVVTAAMARVTEGGRAAVNALRRGEMAGRLGDSKGLVSHGHIALGEAWARAVVAQGAGRSRARVTPDPETLTADDLLHALALEDRSALRAPCPAGVLGQCWSTDGDPPPGDGRVQALVAAVAADLDELARAGFELLAVRSVILCTRRLNDAARAGRSRLVEDLHAMERLVLEMRAIAGGDVDAVCGKVGGYQQYAPVFGPLGGRLHTVIEEGAARSAYRVAGVGQVAFTRDADESDLLVGLASLVGKYLRELTMHRIVAYYRAEQQELPDASGYHDPVTARFVKESATVRRSRGVPDTCFERLKTAELRRG